MARKSLSGSDLVKVYRSRRVVDGVSLSVRTGEVVGLLGPNGAGKTTTFYMLVGFIRPASGQIFLDDTDISNLPMYKRAREGVGYLPQEASVFRRMTVEQNVRAILEMRKMSRQEQEAQCDQLLEDLGVNHLRKSRGYQLSGGERRRVEIARTLANDPAFILLDEPFAGIDPIAVQDIQGIVQNLTDRGLGVLITDHNVQETLRITDRAYILHEGRIVVSGTPEEIVENDQARSVYLGDGFRLERS
ncbi:LPS export ABC transporter ATP-binding protein [bacterium]|nr:MAG: LPS export ABC transporter ATP-binding protein [bacterium]